ncbi:MAG: hypothetical protein GEV10_13830 [Streptosporangiales bacterium]|nr:hypothetical protein [Streptosporangiales bacterium]
MDTHTRFIRSRVTTIAGLVVGAIGIAILWASGVEFPFAVPPGLVILVAGAIFVAVAPWRWVPAVGAFLGLFVVVGFLISPTGVPNLLGEAGTSVAVGQGVQVIGVATALVAGLLATKAHYRRAAGGTR